MFDSGIQMMSGGAGSKTEVNAKGDVWGGGRGFIVPVP